MLAISYDTRRSLPLKEMQGAEHLGEIINNIIRRHSVFFLKPLVRFIKDRFHSELLRTMYVGIHVVAYKHYFRRRHVHPGQCTLE